MIDIKVQPIPSFLNDVHKKPQQRVVACGKITKRNNTIKDFKMVLSEELERNESNN